MSTRDVKQQLEGMRAVAEEHARGIKDPMVVTDRLVSFYGSLRPDARPPANEKIIEWLESGDEAKRYDAMVLIGEFGIVDAIDALRRYADECERAGDTASIRQWEKANRLLADLTAGRE